jgi:putative ribosome biogenesis GTPase RsgA
MIFLRVSMDSLTQQQLADLFDDAQALLECWDECGHQGSEADKAEMLADNLRSNGWAVDELDTLAFRIVTDGWESERREWLH